MKPSGVRGAQSTNPLQVLKAFPTVAHCVSYVIVVMLGRGKLEPCVYVCVYFTTYGVFFFACADHNTLWCVGSRARSAEARRQDGSLALRGHIPF